MSEFTIIINCDSFKQFSAPSSQKKYQVFLLLLSSYDNTKIYSNELSLWPTLLFKNSFQPFS